MQWLKSIKNHTILYLVATLIGILAGSFDALFGIILLALSRIRNQNPLSFIPWLPIAGLGIVYFYRKWGKNSQQGMALIFSAGHGENPEIPKRLVPFAILSTWATHLFGGSAGREGVAVQIGGTIGHTLGSFLITSAHSKTLLITGMAAGFGGLFQTPLAATFFALEIFVPGKIEYASLIPALIAAYTASFTTRFLGLEKFVFPLDPFPGFTAPAMLYLLLAGIIFALAGLLFSQALVVMKSKLAGWVPNPYSRIFIGGAATSSCSC